MTAESGSALVTGGAGFIGSHLVRKLLALGWKVTVLDDGSTGDLERVPEGCRLLVEDMAKLETSHWSRILANVSTVFHLGAKKLNTPGVTGQNLLQANVGATIALAEAATATNVRNFVFASSLYSYGDHGREASTELSLPAPSTLYGMSKLAGEGSLRAVFRETPIHWSVARLYFVYGPRQFPGSGYKSVIVKNFERLRDGLPPVVRGSGRQALDYVYVEDVVDALVVLADRGANGEIYNVSSGDATSILDLTELMMEISGVRSAEMKFVAPDWTEGTFRAGLSSKLQRDFAWRPAVTLPAGLQETWHDLAGP